MPHVGRGEEIDAVAGFDLATHQAGRPERGAHRDAGRPGEVSRDRRPGVAQAARAVEHEFLGPGRRNAEHEQQREGGSEPHRYRGHGSASRVAPWPDGSGALFLRYIRVYTAEQDASTDAEAPWSSRRGSST